MKKNFTVVFLLTSFILLAALASYGQTAPTVFTIGTRTTSTLQMSWTAGTGGTGYLIVRHTAAIAGNPVNGTPYALNDDLGGGKVVAVGNAPTSFTDNFATNGPAVVGTQYFYTIWNHQTTGNLYSAGLAGSMFTLADEPTAFSTGMTFSAITNNNITVGKTSGAGTGAFRMLVARQGSAVSFTPTDGVSYTTEFNSNYTTAIEVGPATQGNKIVGLGNGATFPVSGLTGDQIYHFAIFEFNGAAGSTTENYFGTLGTTLLGNRNTEPTSSASGFTFSAISNTTLTLNWSTSGNGDRRIVLARQDNAVNTVPIDFTAYTASPNWNNGTPAGTVINTDNYVVYDGTGASGSVVMINLIPDKVYHFEVFEYNGAGLATAAYLTPGAIANRSTLVNPPADQPTGFSVTAKLETGLGYTISYAAAPSTPAGYIVLRKNGASAPASTPVGGTVYTAGTNFGDADVAFVDGTPALTFNETTLAPTQQYSYAIYSFNGSGPTISYRLASPLTGTTTALAVEPTANPTAMTFSTLTPTSYNVGFTAAAGSPTGYLAIRRATAGSPTGVPVDGLTVPYAVTDLLGDGVVVMVGTTNPFAQTPLGAETEYFYDIYSFNGAGAARNYRQLSPLENSRFTLSLAPSNRSGAIISILPVANTTNLDINLPDNSALTNTDGVIILRTVGGTAPTTTGVTNGTAPGSLTLPGGTTLVTTTTTTAGPSTVTDVGPLLPNTQYSYTVITYNADAGPNGQTYNYFTSTVRSASATTSCVAPGTQANTLASPAKTAATIDLTWNRGSGDKVIVIARQETTNNLPALANGTAYTADPDFSSVSSSTLAVSGNDYKVVYIGIASTIQVTGLNGNTPYSFAIYEFNDGGGGSNPACYSGSPAVLANVVTTANTATTTIQNGGGINTISALDDTFAERRDVFTFDIRDQGDDSDITDLLAITFTPGPGNQIPFDAIAGVELIDDEGGSNNIGAVPVINPGSIVFAGPFVNGNDEIGEVDEGETKTYTLRAYLKPNLGPALQATIDKLKFVFEVTAANVSVETGDSQLLPGTSTNSEVTTPPNNEVLVTADRIRRTQDVSPTTIPATFPFSTQPIFEATDVNNNRDKDFSGSPTYNITVNTNMPNPLGPASAPMAFSSGLADFTGSGFNFTNLGTSTMTVTANGFTSTPATSSITVTAATTLAGGAIGTTPAGNISNGSTDVVAFGFSLATTGTLLNLTGATVSTTSDPDVVFTNIRLISSIDNDFGTPGDNSVPLAVGTTPGNAINFTSFVSALSSTAKYFFVLADVNNSFSVASPALTMSLTIGNVVVSLGGVVGTTQTGPAYTFIDSTPPSIVSITNTLPTIFEGSLIQTVAVRFSESMKVSGADPVLSIDGLFGAQTGGAWSTSGSFPNDTYTATFTHSGTQETIAAAFSRVTTNVPQDLGNNNVTGAFPMSSALSFIVDTTKPTTSGVTALPATVNITASSVTVTATYSEPMNPGAGVVPTITFAPINGNITPAGLGVWSGGNTVYTRVYNHNLALETIGSTTASVNGARDVAGNLQTVAGVSPAFLIDMVRPAVSTNVRKLPLAATATNADFVTFTVTFSEPVTGVDAADFLPEILTGALPGLTLLPRFVTPFSPTVYDVQVGSGISPIVGNGTFRLNVPPAATITDANGNAYNVLYNSGEQYLIDNTAPTIETINVSTLNPNLVNGYSASINGTTPSLHSNRLEYIVRFSEPTSGVAFANFTPASGLGSIPFPAVSITNGTITPIDDVTEALSTSPSRKWRVTYNYIGGSGLHQTNFSSAGAIIDVAGNVITGPIPTNGQTYTVALDPPPSPVASLSTTANTATSITVNWTDVAGATDYLVILTTAATPAPPVADGTFVPLDIAFGDGRVSQNVPQGTGFVTFTGLTAGTPYNVFIYPYSLSPNTTTVNQTCIDYNIATPAILSRRSDFIRDASFNYAANSNIDYRSFQTTDIPTGSGTGSIVLERFLLRDGGGAADADAFSTSLTSLTLDVVNYQNIRQIALYDGLTEIQELSAGSFSPINATTGRIVFNSLAAFAAGDGLDRALSVRASFNQNGIVDNQIITFTVFALAVNGVSSSQLVTTSPVGITSTATVDQNKIEVTAQVLDFTSIPATTSINIDFGPIVVEARDNPPYSNRDIDFTDPVSAFSNTRSLTYINSPYTPSPILSLNLPTPGVLTFPSNFQFTSSPTPVAPPTTLQISAGGLNGTSAGIGVISSTESLLSYIPASFIDRIPYLTFQSNPIPNSASSFPIATFELRDGNGTPDLDGANTTISSIQFEISTTDNLGATVLGSNDIQQIALYNAAGLELGEQTLSGSTVTFTIGSPANYITAPDIMPMTTQFTLRATFKNSAPNVRDLDNIRVRVINVMQGGGSELNTAAGSVTGGTWTKATGAVAGGTQTPTDKNIVDVVATRLDFTTQPSAFAGINEPFGSAANPVIPIIKARDANLVIDLEHDYVANIGTGGAVPSPSAVTFIDGDLSLNGVQYTSAGNGRITITSNGLTSANPPSSSIACTNVEVLHVTTNPATGGVIGTTNLAGGAVDKIIFGVTFSASYQASPNPDLEKFIISFGNPGVPIKDIFTNFRVFENTSAVFGGPNVTTFGATVTTATNGVPDINGPDLLVSFASPRDLSGNKSYFLQVDVVSTASGSTPPVRPSVIDGGFGTPTDQNITTTEGSASSNVLGQIYTFSAIFPPSLTSSYPASGQLNVSVNQPTLALTFSVPIWTLDNTITLFDQTANTPGVPLTATNGQYSASSGGTVNNRVNPILFNLPTPLVADHVYYITIPQGIFNGPSATDNVGLMDEAGNLFPGFSYAGTLYFKTASTNPPNLLSAPVSADNPSITNASVVGATINATFDQPGTAYFVVFPNSLGITPTANEVKGLSVNPSRVAQGQFNINQIQPTAQFGSIIPLIPQLTAGTLYDVWLSAESYSELNGVLTPVPSSAPLPFGQTGTIVKSGTISGSTSSKLITGVGTSFMTQLAPGRSLFDITGSTLIGTIATITDNTNLTLTTNSAINLSNVSYRASGFEVGAAGPTLQFTPPAPAATVTLNQPSITICNDAFQILTEPIIITESAALNDFSGPLGVDQTINFVLPAGFIFDVTMNGSVPKFGTLTLTGANFTGGGSPTIGFIGNTILAISYRNNGNTSLDKITISGLRVFATGSASGNIRRFGGNALLSVISDLSSVATISAANAQGITFTNSYSIQSFGTTSVTTIPNNFNDPNLSQGLSTQLLPEPPFGDYGPSSFSGPGVNINLLNLSAVTLGTPFNITINHTDNNGCPSSTSEQYTVYDAATAIADLDTEYCTVNTNFDITNPTVPATPGVAGKTHIVTYNRLQAFYLDDLDADVPAFATNPLDATPLATDQIIFGAGWRNVLMNSLLVKLFNQVSNPPAPVGPGGGFDPLNNPIPGREYFNYMFDEATILNAKSIDGSVPNNPYDNFLQVSPQGNNYYNGGSLGTVQFTGQFQSIANSAVRIPLVQNVVFFVPAVPIIETGPPSFLDINDPLNPPGPGNPPNAPLPVVSSNRGTPVYCQDGGLIVINAYPAASAGSSVGTFLIEDAATNSPIVTAAFVDNTNGTATLDPSMFTNGYGDIRVRYTYKENDSPCQSVATQIIRIAPNPVAVISQASLPGPNTPFGTSYCEGLPIGFDGTSSTIAFGLIDRFNWDFGDASNSTFANPNIVTGRLVDPAVPGEPAAGTAGMPNHIFNQSAPYTTNLTVISDVGCSSVPTPQITNIGAVPSVAFTFLGLSTADAIAFNNNSVINSAGTVTDGFAQLDWTYGDGNSLIVTSGFAAPVTNTFVNPGSYTSNLTVTSIIGCRDVLSKSITILPQFTLSELTAYNENFEAGSANWQTLSANAGPSSWAYGTPTTSVIKPAGLLTGSNFWTTNLSGSYNPGERSYLYSPSFDITLLTRAMVSFNTFVQLEQSDGVVVQYSVDNKNVADPTKVWQTLGSLSGGKSTGFGWYDFQGLPSKPGNQTVGDYGWSGDEKTTWFESKHTLDAVTGNRSRAVFRFALASLNAAPALDGFAMDNFRVGNRTRTVLLENFRNAGNTKAEEKSVNEAITKFASNNIGTQLLLINYHTGFPGSDPFNLDNTADPSSRALYYGVTKTPISRLDGSDGGQPQDPFTEWGSDLYDIRTLQLGLADIVFDPATTSAGGKINVKVDITPTINLDENTILHMAVIEDTVSTSTLPAAKSGLVQSNETGFNFILKKMLPSSVGRKVGPLLSGTKYTFDEVWEPDPAKFYPSSISSLRVIVFVQNEVTKDVYQAEVSNDLSYPPIVTGLGEILISDLIKVFPNPADEEVTIQLPAPAPQRVQLQMVDQVGRVVNEHFIAEGERSKTISTRDLAGGIYLLQLGSGDTSTRMKILVVHGK